MNNIVKIQSVIRSKFQLIRDSVTLPSGANIPIIRGVASHSEVQSQKGYRYPKGFWTQIINDADLQKRVQQREMLGMIEHPTDDNDFIRTPYDSDKTSHIVLRAWLEGDEPWIDCGLLNNKGGNAIKALVDVGHHPGCSTRALGDYLEDNISSYLDKDNFHLITWDIVNSPNFEDIKLEAVTDSLMATSIFREAVDMYHLRDSADSAYSRDGLLREMGRMLGELQSKYNKLIEM